MGKTFQAAYIPIGVPTFHQESARQAFDGSLALLRSLCADVAAPEGPLLSVEAVAAFLDTVDPDLIVLQNTTFANAAYTEEVLHRFREAPILLWTLREPVIDGGRLRLNSLTGAYSAANAIRTFRKEPFTFVFGGPEEDGVRADVAACLRAAKLKFDLAHMKLAQIGHTPQGFGFGRAMDLDMRKTFGVQLTSIEVRELIDRAKRYSDEACGAYLADAAGRMKGLEQTPERNRRDFARLYMAYENFVRENGVGALASRCWPDLFTEFGTPVCAVLGILNDLGVAAACEADAYGALSMYIGQQLSGRPAFFGDPASMDERENTVTFWHCGTAACSLAREDTGACVGEHCNRHIGPTLEFGCAPSPRATVFRVGRRPEDGSFRFLIETGEILDHPQQFIGTSLVFRPDGSAEELVRRTVRDGWEPHYAVVFGDVSRELRILADMLNIE
jgi:L-fucose isomerase-like protein